MIKERRVGKRKNYYSGKEFGIREEFEGA